MALLVNYWDVQGQRAALRSHASNVVNVAVLLLAAAVFTGILSGSGMVDAMANLIMKGIPDSMGPHLAVVTAFLSIPLTFFMSNDAYYFGVLPVIAQRRQGSASPPLRSREHRFSEGPCTASVHWWPPCT